MYIYVQMTGVGWMGGLPGWGCEGGAIVFYVFKDRTDE